MKEMWDKRYSEKDYAYGIEPNSYLKHQIDTLKLTGSILLPCEGEGRNAVYAALNNLIVKAFDLSSEGKTKALKLAVDNNVKIEYLVGDFEDHDYKSNSFDVISLIYAHFPEKNRERYHKTLVNYLKPGGIFIIEGFSKSNLQLAKSNPKLGGPKKVEMLYSIDQLKNDFLDLDILENKEEVIELNEGLYHIGNGSVVRFMGRKKHK